MAIGQIRTNGTAAGTTVFGYQPLVIKVTMNSGLVTADTGGNGAAIVEGGYTKATRAMQQFGSVVWQANILASGFTTFVVAVDGATFNAGPGPITAGAYGALRDAFVAALGGTATVTTSSALNGDGTFTFA